MRDFFCHANYADYANFLFGDVMEKLLYQDESYKIVGCAMEVHRQLGTGFSEKVYQDALEIEFKLQGIPYEREKHITIDYKGQTIDHDYFADFVCYDNIIVELKAVTAMCDAHSAQVINYLCATHKKLGLLINFGEISLKYKRIINTQKK